MKFMGNQRKWSVAKGLAIYGVIVLALAGCGRDRPSQIVRMVENQGAGDLRIVSIGSMVQWLEKHPVLALKVENLCIDVRKNTLAAWPETNEGRLCNPASRGSGKL